jgi:hypothetical protein
MRSTSAVARHIRLASVLALGAFALHQLRYLLAYGGESGHELARQGHDYLASALPVLGVLALAALLATALRARLGPRLTGTRTANRVLSYAAALLAVYSGQELLEGAVTAGHPGGVAALTADGGWIALPLALVFGLVVAIAVRFLERVEVALAPYRDRRAAPRAPRVRGNPRPVRRRNPLLAPLAFGLARRPPPTPA